jgi:hypothetical protein
MRTINLELRIVPSTWKIELLRSAGVQLPALAMPDHELDVEVGKLISSGLLKISPAFRREIEHFADKSRYDRLRASSRNITKRGARLHYSLDGFDRLRCIYIHIPKTGGESIASALFGNVGAGHLRAYGLHMIFGPDFRRYFKFAFVRNPYDRLVSAYEYLRAGGHPAWEMNRRFSEELMSKYRGFEDFVDDLVARRADFSPYRVPHFHSQTDILMLDGKLAVDYLGYFETLAEDFATVAARLGLSVDLPHRNASHAVRPPSLSYYADPRVRDKVCEFYRRDFEVLGYSRDCYERAPVDRVLAAE